MEPIKQLSILLESSTEATIHDTLDYFLRLLYDKLERGTKRRVGSCTVFNTFVNTFRRKLLTLLDDVEQFFLWVVAAALDGSRDVPLAKNPSTGTVQQRLFLVLKIVLHAVVVISEVLRLNIKSRCSRCCKAHL